MSNVLSEEKKQQVIALGRLGWTLRRIERETGIRRETISVYLKEAGVALRLPRGRRLSAKPASPVDEVTTDSESPNTAIEVTTDSEAAGPPAIEPKPSRNSSTSASEPFHELIQAGLARGRNAMGIWQDLVDQSAFTGAYQSVKRYVRKLRGASSPEPRAVIITAPGEEAQVDYGDGPMVRDPHTGKYRRTRLFVMTLGYGRKSVRLLTFHSSSRIWCELHEQAFRRLGGSVRVVVLDNLREGVLAPDIYDPTLNPLYRDVLAHYGAVEPTRIGHNLIRFTSCQYLARHPN